MLVIPGSAAEAAGLAVVGTMLSYPGREVDAQFRLVYLAGRVHVDLLALHPSKPRVSPHFLNQIWREYSGASARLLHAIAVVRLFHHLVSLAAEDNSNLDLSAAGMFELDAATKQVRAVSGAGVGHCTRSVSFAHEDVVRTITVQLADFVALVVSATPSPSYSGSTTVYVNLLSSIGGSSPLIYEAAALRLEMVLTTGSSSNHRCQLLLSTP
jgi:hypothetical protein